MLFKTRKERNLFLQDCYSLGTRIARRRYPLSSIYEERFTYQDIVSGAIVQMQHYLSIKKFQSTEHARAWFCLCLRTVAANYRRNFNKYISLDSPNYTDNNTPLIEFIAARLVYPTLEDEESELSVNQIIKSLTKQEQTIVKKAWIEELSVDEIAKEIKHNKRYIQRCLDGAKLKLGRKLMR